MEKKSLAACAIGVLWVVSATATTAAPPHNTLLAFLNAGNNGPSVPDARQFQTGRENQTGLTFSPDGRTAWWAAWDGKMGKAGAGRRAIYVSQWGQDGWSKPVPESFTGEFDDDDPSVSADGQWLYFVSTRPASPDDAETRGDIWRYRLREPYRLERPMPTRTVPG